MLETSVFHPELTQESLCSLAVELHGRGSTTRHAKRPIWNDGNTRAKTVTMAIGTLGFLKWQT